MLIATVGNVRTTVAARQGIGPAFRVAFNSGAVMGFGLCGFAVLGLITICLSYGRFIVEPLLLMEMVAGFGLGGSTVALFARVGGGIYTKAADVGADLVGKVEQGIPEDDPRNPAVIADNVGDNVGDIAGMGADLFGSCAEGTCAALVIGASASAISSNQTALFFPIMISAIGIPVCLVTSFFARMSPTATSAEPTLKATIADLDAPHDGGCLVSGSVGNGRFVSVGRHDYYANGSACLYSDGFMVWSLDWLCDRILHLAFIPTDARTG